MNEYNYLSNKEIKHELTRMLAEVDAYMYENNFEYTIFSGTLLGAVRHGGFIPWDDDIDIAMLRPEYEKLLDRLRKEGRLNDHLMAVGYELGNGELPYIKIVNKTIMTEEQVSPFSVEQGFLWIDIFPLDGVPKEGIKDYYSEIQKLESEYLGKRINTHHWIMDEAHNSSAVLRMKDNLKWTFVNLDTVTEQYINLGKKHNIDMEGIITNNLWGVGYKEAFSARIMKEMVDYKFEDITVKGIKNADEWLTIRYGDYMKLPPENERVNHGLKAWRV